MEKIYTFDLNKVRRVNLKTMSYFLAVAEEGNFRKAAERLNMTQPPLSRQIKMLEEDLGDRLFDRTATGARLTFFGVEFQRDVILLFNSLENIHKYFDGTQVVRDAGLKVAYTSVVDTCYSNAIEKIFKRSHPEVKIIAQQKNSQASIKEIIRGTLDAAIIGLPAITDNLTLRRLDVDPMMVAISSNHILSKKSELSLRDIEQEMLFWFKRSLNKKFYDVCEEIFCKFNYKPERLAEPKDHHVLLGMIAAGDGIALLPTSLSAIKRDGVSYIKLKERDFLKIEVALVYDKLTSNIKKLLDAVDAAFGLEMS